MSYRLEPEEIFSAGIKRMALEQIDKALGHLTNPREVEAVAE